MLKIAVVGFGFMGMMHASNIIRNNKLELVAVVDKFPEHIRTKLNELPGNFATGTISEDALTKIRVYTTLEDCLSAEKLDACVVSVHTLLHHKLSCMALHAGVNVFLEKPFSLSEQECNEMIDLATKKGLILMVGHVVRFMPAYLKLKSWIDSGEFGKPEFLHLSRFSGLPVWGQWKERQKDSGSSGGALFDLSIHDIDFVQWVFGAPDVVQSQVLPGKLSRHDYLSALWKYNTGFVVKIEGGNIFHTSFPFRAGYVAKFEKATVEYSSSSPEYIRISTDDAIVQVPGGDANEGFSGELNYFVNCLFDKTFPELCTPESALDTIRICYRHIL